MIVVAAADLRLIEDMSYAVAVRLDAAAKAPRLEREHHLTAARGIADSARALAQTTRWEGGRHVG